MKDPSWRHRRRSARPSQPQKTASSGIRCRSGALTGGGCLNSLSSRAPRAAGRTGLRLQLRSSQHPLHHRRQGRAARPAAALHRRGARRRLRQLPDVTSHLGRQRGGAQGPVLRLPYRPAIWRGASHRRAARQGHRTHSPLAARGTQCVRHRQRTGGDDLARCVPPAARSQALAQTRRGSKAFGSSTAKTAAGGAALGDSPLAQSLLDRLKAWRREPRRTPPIRRLPPGGGPLNVPAHASC